MENGTPAAMAPAWGWWLPCTAWWLRTGHSRCSKVRQDRKGPGSALGRWHGPLGLLAFAPAAARYCAPPPTGSLCG